MSDRVRITVLVENSVHRAELGAEHGLACHVEIGSHSLLFDTGQTDLVLRNATTLGIDLCRLDAVVLSHGHYDHTGGLPAVRSVAPNVHVYAHPGVCETKYSKRADGEARFIGMSSTATRALRREAANFSVSPAWTEILRSVFVTGEISRATKYEDTGGAFFLDAACTRPDPLMDDQALVIDLGASVVLLLGCAHAGVVNTLDHVAQFVGAKPLRAVIGGFHLGQASSERLARTLARLRSANLTCVAPLHCTGWPATAALWQALPEVFRAGSVGSVFEFEPD